MPAILLGGRGMFQKALAVYAAAFIAVAAGAFGAHALRSRLTPEMLAPSYTKRSRFDNRKWCFAQQSGAFRLHFRHSGAGAFPGLERGRSVC